MSLTIPAPIGPLPELESKPSKAGRLVTRLRSLADGVARVQGWAERRSADGAGWKGDAAEAADHESARFSRQLEAPEAALYSAAAAAEVFEDTLTILETTRTDLDAQRVALNEDIAEATEAIRAWDPASPFANSEMSQARAAAISLTFRALRIQGGIDTWTKDVVAAETAFITALQSVDTAAEATKVVDQVKAEEVRRRQVRRAIDDLIDQGVLPPEIRGMNADQLTAYLKEHPEIAGKLVANDPHTGMPGFEGLLASDLSREDARNLFDSMRPEDAALLAQLYPDEIGNLSGVPFENRADANMVTVIDQLNRINHVPDNLVNDDLAATRDLYQSIIDNDRQIILFDPAHSRIAELHGHIGPDTKNVGVHVPGTFSDIPSFQGIADRSNSFVDARYDGSLAMISWEGGVFPPNLVEAADGGYADDLGPRLADFSHDVRQEIDHAGAGDAQTTYMGHSYGGAIVGTSEQSGLDADRVLHVESAGMGKGVDSPGDLPPSQEDVRRYAMTAPDDFINLVQGLAGGHGADPNNFDGTLRLETGNYADGTPIDGIGASHSGVFKAHSDAWNNMYEVLTGGTVTTYDPREVDNVVSPYGPGSFNVGDRVPDMGSSETVDIP